MSAKRESQLLQLKRDQPLNRLVRRRPGDLFLPNKQPEPPAPAVIPPPPP